MTKKKPLRKITISQLTVGMHVVGLDISWIDSPFLTHSKRIKSQTDIEKLKKSGAKVITIDPNKGDDLTTPEDKSEEVTKASESEPETEEKPSVPEATTPLNKELSVAREIKGKLTKAIKSLQDDIAANKAISASNITPLIDQTLESLERNSQALMSLAHISRRSQKLVDHTFSTFCIALNLAQFKQLPDEEKNILGLAALLHESGWANLPLQIMGKRKAYSPTETALLQKHPELGVKCIKSADLPETVLRIIREHHELCDGSGYPNQLKGEEIHTLSKIFSVVDSYDEMVHQLRDTPGMLPTNALRKLYKDAEKGVYVKEYVAALIAMIGIYPVSSAVRLSNGEKGIVREVPGDKHLSPVVDIHYDRNGKPVSPPKQIDLSIVEGEDALEIASVLDPNNPQDDPMHLLVLDV